MFGYDPIFDAVPTCNMCERTRDDNRSRLCETCLTTIATANRISTKEADVSLADFGNWQGFCNKCGSVVVAGHEYPTCGKLWCAKCAGRSI